MSKRLVFIFFVVYAGALSAQNDSLDNERLAKMVTLTPVTVRTDINVAKFIERVKKLMAK